ncbi:MAG: hypothetical protein HPY76_04930 [Anaerolineae bacterium]|nr:hypothetical protein [Anaerolineae bacterium]
MGNPYNNISLYLRAGITIFPSQDKAIEEVLVNLLERCPAQHILLLDSSGLLINSLGGGKDTNPVSLASLIAADLAASKEIANLTRQYNNCQLVMREGERTNTFIVEAGQYLILFVQLSKDVPLGWARLMINETANQIADIIKKTPETAEQSSIGTTDEDLSSQIDDSINDLWSQ